MGVTRSPAEFTVFIDGACPLCRREARLLERLDRGRGGLRLVDIAGADFDATACGVSMGDLMGSIHGRTADGRMVTGMDVFRRAYAAVGLGWLLAPTGWPGVRLIFDPLYRWFARNRLRWTRRGDACGGSCSVAVDRRGG